MIPLRIGTPQQFTALRRGLLDAGYTEEPVCRHVGIESIFDFKMLAEGRKRGAELRDGLDVLVRLLMDSEVMAEEEILSYLPAETLRVLEDLDVAGRLEDDSKACYAKVVLYPVASLLVASDRTMPVKGQKPGTILEDVVYAAISANTRRFLLTMPEWPCDTFLELCAGTGIAAMVAASRYARKAWACDITERSTHFAEFNRLLNGLDNVVTARGDLYEAVGDRKFDRIVAHPPYIPSVSAKAGLILADGGDDGEQIFRRIIEELPQRLNPGGTLYCVTMATDREEGDLQDRIRQWLGASQDQFDVFLVATGVERKPEDLLKMLMKGGAKVLEPGPTSKLYERLKVTGVYYGAVVLRRKTESRPAATGRTKRGGQAGAEAIDWFVKWESQAAEPGFTARLLSSRPRYAPTLEMRVTHSVRDGALQPTNFEVKTEHPFSMEAECPGWLAVMLGACDGTRTLREIYEEQRSQEMIPPGMGPEDAAAQFRILFSAGLLELAEFPLPRRTKVAASSGS